MESLRYVNMLDKIEGRLVTSMNPFINTLNYTPIEDILKAMWDVPRNVTIDAEKVAKEKGSIKAANIVVLRAASPSPAINFESLEKAIGSIFAKKGQDIINLNLSALSAGKNYADKRT